MDKIVFDLIVQALTPEMDDINSRKALILSALYDSPVIHKIDWHGSALDFTRRFVLTLDEYGDIKPNYPAIVAVLEETRKQSGNDRQAQFDYLIKITYTSSKNRSDIANQPLSEFGSPLYEQRTVDQKYVYIAYAREDGQQQASRIYNELLLNGFSAWWDERDIDPFQDFTSEIEKAIERASHIVVCLTPSLIDRKDSFLRREMIYAQGWEKSIIPLLLDGFAKRSMPLLINHLIPVDFTNFEAGFTNLTKRLSQQTLSIQPHFATVDIFRPYLQLLYRQIVDRLDKTVFTLIDLQSNPVDDKVETDLYIPHLNMLQAGFVGLNIKDTTSEIGDSSELLNFETFSEAFNHYEGRILLLGEPGSGKTTTLFAFARDVVAQRLENPLLPVPLLAPISSWDPNNLQPFDEWLSKVIPLLDRNTVKELMYQQNTLLLLDGLDELGSERIRRTRDSETARETLQEYDPRASFISGLKRSGYMGQIVVTCRIREYEEIGRKLSLRGAVKLQPLDNLQLKNFLSNYPSLWDSIQSDTALSYMSRLPLTLSLITFAYTQLGKEQANFVNLARESGQLTDFIFELYIRKRYEHEAMRSNISLSFSIQDLYSGLGLIAMEQVTNARYYAAETYDTELRKACEHIWDPEFTNLAIKLNLILNNEHTFMHALIRDYFALPYCLKYAIDVKSVFNLGAVEALGRIRDPRAAYALINCLAHENEIIVLEATWSLGMLGGSVATTLIYALGDSRSQVRNGTKSALVRLGNQAIRPLIQALNDVDDFIRSEAVEVLGRLAYIGYTEVADSLIERLDDTSYKVRCSIAEALVNVGDKANIKYLQILLNDPNRKVRRAARKALLTLQYDSD
jgi:hypothetical protein